MEQTNSKAEALLEQGMDYIENDAVDRGLPYLKQAAELGLLEAQAMYLGTLLLSEDSDKDYTKEIKKCVECRLHPDGVQYAGAAQCAAVSVLHGGGLCPYP